jgi:hypothetical protein
MFDQKKANFFFISVKLTVEWSERPEDTNKPSKNLFNLIQTYAS